MNKTYISTFALGLLTTFGLAQSTLPAQINLEKIGLQTPESVFYDAKNDVYLVSNINGNPLGEDNNGFISRFAPDGTLLNLKWVEGGANGLTLNAPKGMTSVGNTLYVTDINNLRKFNLKTGKSMGEIAFPDATFLNDLTSDKSGTAYMSDIGFKAGANGFEPSGTDTIYKISRSGKVSILAKGPQLTNPNGLEVLSNGKIQVVTFGSKEIYTLDKKGQRGDVITMPAGSLDGVVQLADGRLLISSWETSSIYAVGTDGAVTLLVDKLASPADIGWDSKRERVLVPLFSDNAVVIQALK
jgi:hypothetical protein